MTPIASLFNALITCTFPKRSSMTAASTSATLFMSLFVAAEGRFERLEGRRLGSICNPPVNDLRRMTVYLSELFSLSDLAQKVASVVLRSLLRRRSRRLAQVLPPLVQLAHQVARSFAGIFVIFSHYRRSHRRRRRRRRRTC